jgi:ABC-type phosphate/phosphonate transport system substrate-binding protein
VSGRLTLGAVAYDPKVVTIWDGFRRWFAAQGLDVDYVLFSNYERQVEELLAGTIDVAWNSPLAWVRTRRLAEAAGGRARPLAMRDTDRDLTSVVVVRDGEGVDGVQDLTGRVVGTGAVDSPQATLLPLAHLGGLGMGADVTVRRFEVGVGLHGDHVGGERDAARALVAGEVDAACLIDGNHLLFAREGVIAAGATRVVAQTAPYDHCNMTVVDGPNGPDPERAALLDRFTALLLAMDYGDPLVRPLLDLEGLKQWLPGRVEGYGQLEAAADTAGFYDRAGRVTAEGYRP